MGIMDLVRVQPAARAAVAGLRGTAALTPLLLLLLLCPFCASQYGGFADAPQQPAASGSADSSGDGCCAAAGSSSGSSSKAMVSIPQGHGDLCDIPASHVFPLSVMKFRGVPVSVPGDVPAVLRYRYGDTYMIPRCVC